MLYVHTGANRCLSGEMAHMIGAALAEEDGVQYIVVPKQLTLLTERMLIAQLKLRGSFRLRVLSPARLCSLIFDEAGSPEGVRIDDRGRVMLIRRAIHACESLSIYKNADRRRGFAEKCARQLEIFMQAGVSADDLRACAGDCPGVTALKLNDLAAILDQYSTLVQGRYQDGETELIEAAQRVQDAPFIARSRFWFFGFDITPPTLNHLIGEIAARCPRADVFFPIDSDATAADRDSYLPLEKALGRLLSACRDSGAQVKRRAILQEKRTGEIAALERGLFACPVVPHAGPCSHIRVSPARDMRSECSLAAATARRLAMSGMRYGDMQLLCPDLDAYRQLLIEAFHAYDVPLVLESSRPVSRMATAQCLLTALSLIDKNFRSEDVFTLMRCGYMDISRDEADRLANYAIRRGIDGSRWLRPLSRGNEAEIGELEPVRQRLMAPVAKLREDLKAAKDLPGQLAALFGFLTGINAHGRSHDLQQQLVERGLREEAGVLAQSWNRIIGALDQMASLMGEKRLSLRELTQTLTEALEAAVVKPLPQSGDAVYAQGAGRMLHQHARALFVLGLNDAASSGDEGLLTSAQKHAVDEKTKSWLGPDDTDSVLMKRFYLKSALGMTDGEVYLSCALSGGDGAAQRPGMILHLVREIFPDLQETGMDAQQEIMCCAPRAMLQSASRTLSARREGEEPDPMDA